MTAIANNHVVSFHYTLTNAEGETLDQSQGEPLAYLHGAYLLLKVTVNIILTLYRKFQLKCSKV